MLDDLLPIGPPAVMPGLTGQGGHVHFINQVSQECGLRQNLGVEERRTRLKHDGQQFRQPMKPARRVDVVERHGEDQATHQSGHPVRGSTARIPGGAGR